MLLLENMYHADTSQRRHRPPYALSTSFAARVRASDLPRFGPSPRDAGINEQTFRHPPYTPEIHGGAFGNYQYLGDPYDSVTPAQSPPSWTTGRQQQRDGNGQQERDADSFVGGFVVAEHASEMEYGGNAVMGMTVASDTIVAATQWESYHASVNDLGGAALSSQPSSAHLVTLASATPSASYRSHSDMSVARGTEEASRTRGVVGTSRQRQAALRRRGNATTAIVSCPYPWCNATFTRRHNLNNHTQCHEDEKLYLCGVQGCTSRFNTEDARAGHRRRQHAGLPEA
ncbi:hypothetical protein BD626DRAFT_573788 [Schizophyllum amplum]|uniref:C2H2-type domain-containing protein n=1 Tax=Schizophyllum amplum TaxID=97359 RepID=A0A550C026_9AGAR|nr:hypothetical protein BD626DRAFT_573788 [Auriculariopsis ampla]